MAIVTATQATSQYRQRQPGMRFWRRLAIWRAVAAQRRQLAMLDGRELADIGISRIEARNESARLIWDLPNRFRT